MCMDCASYGGDAMAPVRESCLNPQGSTQEAASETAAKESVDEGWPEVAETADEKIADEVIDASPKKVKAAVVDGMAKEAMDETIDDRK